MISILSLLVLLPFSILSSEGFRCANSLSLTPRVTVTLRCSLLRNANLHMKVCNSKSKVLSRVLRDGQGDEDSTISENIVAAYFDAWNQRDMERAVDYFAESCFYEDTQYSNAFEGKDALRQHLFRVSAALPKSFVFVIDDMAVDKRKNTTKIGVQWHVENNGVALPFTRGCSFYTVDNRESNYGLISTGFDVPEPAPLKPGGFGLFLLSFASKLIDEPVRAIPAICWILYLYIVFFSNGILPGKDALQLDPKTWEEVRDLSLNFFLVAPILKLPFSPVVHPMLEGVFNVLLAWAALFSGFLSDDRKEKPNLIPMLPVVIGMQLLTSAFFLPYLSSRTSEPSITSVVYTEELEPIHAALGESPFLGPVLAAVGSASIAWFFLGRQDQFGSVFADRYDSFVSLLSVDRVGSSFLVDLAIFGIFQGWLVDDDLKRRGVNGNEYDFLRFVSKFVPFFGLVIYFALRPELRKNENN